MLIVGDKLKRVAKDLWSYVSYYTSGRYSLCNPTSPYLGSSPAINALQNLAVLSQGIW